MSDADKIERFAVAFSTHGGGSQRVCECGRVFYNPGGGWDWEEGELERLEKSDATSLEWTVESISFDGREYVADCDCWHKEALRFMRWIDEYAQELAGYLNGEKRHKEHEAELAPTVD